MWMPTSFSPDRLMGFSKIQTPFPPDHYSTRPRPDALEGELELLQNFVMAATPESKETDHDYHALIRASTADSCLFSIARDIRALYEPNILREPSLYFHGFPDQDLLNYARGGGI
jgi:hypothetical protein